jgi:hypothetical protein
LRAHFLQLPVRHVFFSAVFANRAGINTAVARSSMTTRFAPGFFAFGLLCPLLVLSVLSSFA